MACLVELPEAQVLAGDCLQAMAAMPECSVDAIVTDPPYGLGFMGKAWDGLPPGEEWARACLRVLKPGGHLLAFGGTRTWHRLAVAVEDAGFEMRDSIAWLYGSGFPKSMDVSKAIDKAVGARREVVGVAKGARSANTVSLGKFSPEYEETAPATPEAERWSGWGTALKPAHEPIVVARKPLAGTVAANVLAHGTGALNIDGCRVGDEGGGTRCTNRDASGECVGHPDAMGSVGGGLMRHGADTSGGRWPTNVVLDDTQAAELDQQTGTLTSGANPVRRNSDKFRDACGDFKGQTECTPARGADSCGASRFFYVAKAPKSERPKVDGIAHPTVKPVTLMRWLVRLVTPPGGIVLDPFAGSGTTLEAARSEGFRSIGIEREPDYLCLIDARLNKEP